MDKGKYMVLVKWEVFMLILGYRWRGGTCLKAVDCVDEYYVKGSIWVVITGG